jgi:hypothetical protein
MDIANFAECLSYIINKLNDTWKSRKDLENKKTCIDEDLHHLRHSLLLAAKESMSVLVLIYQKRRVRRLCFASRF